MAYDYKREVAPDNWASMTRSRSKVNTFYGQAEGEYSLDKKWFFTANVSAHQHLVRSEDKNIILQDGGKAIVGYDKGRVELSGSVSAKWQPIDRLGMSVVLREEMYGSDWIPLIPAFFIDGIISPKGNVMLKASISRNYRFPTLNDLYFLPGGNPNLKNEQGFSYDAGVSFDVGKKGIYKLSGGANWFDSYIDDWIIWLPTTKGFFSPRNVKKVHAYGVEVKANFAVQPAKDWLIDLNGSYSWTPSINEGEKMSPADQSVGKQLPYVPKHSASLTGRLSWRTWAFLYKWAFYSERYTMSSNDYTLTGHLPEYFMSNVSLEKNLFFKPVDIQLKFAVNNLFNEYASGFDIKGADGKKSVLVTVTNPWQGADSITTNLFIARDDEEVPADFTGQMLKGDAERIVCMSSTHIAMLDAIGETGRVVGVSGIDYISNPDIQARRDSVGDVGYEGNINYELLLSLDPDLVLLYGVNGASSMEGKLKELDIPFMYVGDYLEESPLGKAEWLVALSEVIGKRAEGEKVFAEIPVRYNVLKKKVADNILDAPSVMLNTPYGDSWFMPSTESYVARLIKDAGGDYIYKKNTGNASAPIDLEEAYLLASQADMWLHVGMANTLDELKAACPKFIDTRCFRGGQVYNNNARTNAAGGNDYYESAVVNPDLVLRDLVKIFHPELVEEDFVYYKQLK